MKIAVLNNKVELVKFLIFENLQDIHTYEGFFEEHARKIMLDGYFSAIKSGISYENYISHNSVLSEEKLLSSIMSLPLVPLDIISVSNMIDKFSKIKIV